MVFNIRIANDKALPPIVKVMKDKAVRILIIENNTNIQKHYVQNSNQEAILGKGLPFRN